MDKPSGLKECPRCGLRNRGGAYQCDFCGWDFRAASDDWMGKVNELQRINKEVEAPVLDKRTTSKIEMTIVKPEEVPVKEPKPEMEVPRKLELEEHSEIETAEETSAVEGTIVQDEPSTIANEEPISIISIEEQLVPETRIEDEAVPMKEDAHATSFDVSRIVPPGLLISGAAIYGITLLMASGSGIDISVGWIMAIFGALFMVTGLAMVYMKRSDPNTSKDYDESEVVLCPECHEVVTDLDPSCPNCGARFKDVPSKE